MNKKPGKRIDGPLKAAIIGAGSRAMKYSSYALTQPDELKIVAVVEPDPFRREQASKVYDIPKENCCETVESLLVKNIGLDVAINGTMDADHVVTALPVLNAGYDLLLEKPIALNKKELMEIYRTARKNNNRIMICHVLRYAPFYQEIKKHILCGDLGKIVSINTEENVSYHHIAAAYVRGKWNNSETCGSRILMAKCCHDLDIITWLKHGIAPKYVSSFGGLMNYRTGNAPQGSGNRCLIDCGIEDKCPYSARKNYIDQGLWQKYAWRIDENRESDFSKADKLNSLKYYNPFGRCVWHCDNNVEDHQSVMIVFEDGSTAVHTLTGGSTRSWRRIHIVGTKGELHGVLEDGRFVIMHPDIEADRLYTEETIELDTGDDMHGGGDMALVADFVRTMKGHPESLSYTGIEDSLYGHLIGFAADEAMRRNKVVRIKPIK